MEAANSLGSGSELVVQPGGTVAVGFEGSLDCHRAVEWAAAEALARDSLLRVVTCSAVPDAVDYYGIGARQRRQNDEAAGTIRALYPTLKLSTSLTHLDQRDALTVDLTVSDLLVLGSPGRGSAHSWLLGSVPRTATRTSPCPVVVVRGAFRPGIRRILVGIDSSTASVAAADWACQEADLHGANMVVLHAWLNASQRNGSLRERHLAQTDLESALDLVVKRCRQRTTAPVIGQLVHGEPASVLNEASADVDLLALGSRGRSGFTTMLFGSVALAVADEAQCPVAILHPRPIHQAAPE